MVDKNQKYEDILPFYCIFRAFGSFYCDIVILNVHVCLGRTKTRSPEFGTVLHWRPPDVHIFHTDPSLFIIRLISFIILLFWVNMYHVYDTATRVGTKINGHKDKRSEELFKYKWCKQQICSN